MSNKDLIIIKFGGTSVSTKERIETIISIVEHEKMTYSIIVVVSALGGVTDLLLSLQQEGEKEVETILQQIRNKHETLIKDLWKGDGDRKKILSFIDKNLKEIQSFSKRKRKGKAYSDRIVSYGEIMSSYIISNALVSHGILSEQIKATECIVTDANFGSAEFLREETIAKTNKILLPLIKKGITPIVTGFIASTVDGKITTLGRGGSDYTAAILGFALNASEVQIWTDVNGIMTADPKIVKNAKTVAFVSYDEASELAMLGAKVLHPKTILPAIEKNIPVRILNTFDQTHTGTTIMKEVKKPHHITSVACKRGKKVIDIHASKMFNAYGFLYKIFGLFGQHKISVDFISTSEINISLTIDGKYDTTKLVKELEKFGDVEVKNNRATISVVGHPLGAAPIIPGRIHTHFEERKINVEMICVGPSKINETIVVKEEDADEAVRILHQGLF